jgi:hypothetical protein
MNTYKEQEYYDDEYDNYDKYEDILFKSKQKGGGGKAKQNNVSCYSSKHVRIQQSKVYSKK